jgi:hypothetical protein
MAKTIKIIPSLNRIEFTGSTADTTASIEMDNLGRLKISSSQVIFGDGSSNDIYIGDGSGSSYVVFDQNGGIKGEAGSNVRVTLGSYDTRVELTGSQIDIDTPTLNITGPALLNLPPITSSYALIKSGSFTGSINVTDISLSDLTSSNANITNLFVSNLTASALQLSTGSAIQFTSSDATIGGFIELDNLGNLVLDSVSGSVYLSRDNGDVFIGDGTSSANIVFDFDGAIKGEDGQAINLTIGSPTTTLYITGSRIELGAITASSALIQGGIITASSAVIGDVEIENDSININNITSSYAIINTSLVANRGTFNFISASNSVTSSRFVTPVNGELLFTGSASNIGGRIALDPVGNLILSSVSGSVFFGNGGNDVYVGDGTGSANLIFDAGGTIKAGDASSLTIGSANSTLYITGSSITINNDGGNTTINGTTNATGSFNGSFTGIFINPQVITDDLIIPSNVNAMLIGDISISGSITIQTNSILKIS